MHLEDQEDNIGKPAAAAASGNSGGAEATHEGFY
jgi:hypothetical protein